MFYVFGHPVKIKPKNISYLKEYIFAGNLMSDMMICIQLYNIKIYLAYFILSLCNFSTIHDTKVKLAYFIVHDAEWIHFFFCIYEPVKLTVLRLIENMSEIQ